MSLFIAFACYDTMKMHTAFATASAFASWPGDATLNMQRGPYTHRNRERLLEDALKDKANTHLMFLDTDVMFPPDGIQRLLAHDKDIVGGAYNLRAAPPPGSMEVPRFSAVKPLDRTDPLPTELAQVTAVPTGFMLIKLDSVREMPRPWFWFSEDEHGHIGEDVWFCLQARRHGCEVWCDPTIPIAHIGEFFY